MDGLEQYTGGNIYLQEPGVDMETGLPNWASYDLALEEHAETAPLSLVCFDLDGTRAVVLRLGDAEAAQLVAAVGTCLRDLVDVAAGEFAARFDRGPREDVVGRLDPLRGDAHTAGMVCTACGGNGYLKLFERLGDVPRVERCTSCDGTGRVGQGWTGRAARRAPSRRQRNRDRLRALRRAYAGQDGLTRLGPSWQFARLVRRDLRWRRPGALVMCDLDGFRSFNDWGGHQVGDDLLTQVGLIFADAIAAFRRRMSGPKIHVVPAAPRPARTRVDLPVSWSASVDTFRTVAKESVRLA